MLALSAKEIADTGLSWAHLDIMDAHFVDNLTFGPQMLAALKAHEPDLFYDTHLMLDEPWKYTESFAKAGAGLISIHIEPAYDHRAELNRIRAMGPKCGIVLNPATPVEAVIPVLDAVDLVLVMSVQPGRGGQPFREETLPKMRRLKDLREEMGLSYRIEVDGGVDARTAPLCIAHGADTLVAGTAFFKAEDKKLFARNIGAL